MASNTDTRPMTNSVTIKELRASLTAKQPSKVEAYKTFLKRPKSIIPSRFLIFTKWFVICTLLALLVACSVFSKTSIIALSVKLMTSSTNSSNASLNIDGNVLRNEPQKAPHESAVYFMMLCVLLLAPNAATLLHSVWLVINRRNLPMPTYAAILTGLLCSALETFGLCLFVFKVFTTVPPLLGIMLANGVYFVPLLHNLVNCFLIGVSAMKRWLILFIVAFIFEGVGVGITIAIPFTSTVIHPNRVADLWYLVAAIACVSIAWLAPLQEIQSTPRRKRSLTVTSTDGNGHAKDVHNVNTGVAQAEHIMDRVHSTQEQNAQRTNSIISTAFRIILIPVFAVVLAGDMIVSKGDSVKQVFIDGWKWGANPNLYLFIVNLVTSLVGQYVAYLACTMNLDVVCFALPLILATPLITILVAIPATCEWFMVVNKGYEVCNIVKGENTTIILTIVAILSLFVGHLLSTGVLIVRSKGLVLRTGHQIFWIPGYNGVLFEQWLLLNRRTKKALEDNEDSTQRHRNNQVFICTTMYREVSRH